MPISVRCPKCNSQLKTDDKYAGQNVGCPKCKAIIPVPPVMVGKPLPAKPDRTAPFGSRHAPALVSRSWLFFAIPVFSIMIGLGALSLTMFLRQNSWGIVAASFAVVLSVAGFICFFVKTSGGFFANLCGLAISAASLVIAIGYPAIGDGIQEYQSLVLKNEKLEKQAKSDLEEAKKKLDLAEEAPRKAAEFLKQAEEAPKKAEEFYKKAKETQAKWEASEINAGKILAQSEVTEKAAKVLGAKAQEERKKAEEIDKETRKIQQSVDETKKETDEKKKELVDLQKKIEQDQVDLDKKAKEVRILLQKIEDAFKGALLNLKSKNPEERIRAVKGLGRLADFNLPKETSKVICEVIAFDPIPKVGLEALNSLEKINPDIYPDVVTLVLPPSMSYVTASSRLASLKNNKGKPALPVLHMRMQRLIAALNTPYAQVAESSASTPIFTLLEHYTANVVNLDPSDKQTIALLGGILSAKGYTRDDLLNHNLSYLQATALNALGKMAEADRQNSKLILPLIMAKVNDVSVQVVAITNLASMGPQAKEAVPLLRELRLHPSEGTRRAVLDALKKIEEN